MLFLFLFLVVLGLGVFFYLFMKEFKAASTTLPDQVPSVSSAAASGMFSQEMIELKAVCEAAVQKAARLEQMLAEKNAIIAHMQKDVLSGDDYQGQVDSLKQILQGQIETLKQQNKAVKDDLARVLEENMALQAKIFAIDARKSSVEPPAEDVVLPKALLQDVFSPEDKSKF